MTKYYLRSAEDPILRQRAEDVVYFSDLVNLLDYMHDFMLIHRNAIGLAAPQIGDSRRVAVARIDVEIREFINPVIIKKGLYIPLPEGCLSLPGYKLKLRRTSVDVQYNDRHGNSSIENYACAAAIILQHETDHLDGKLI